MESVTPSPMRTLARLRRTPEYRKLNGPFRRYGYIDRNNFPGLVHSRRMSLDRGETFAQWVACYLSSWGERIAGHRPLEYVLALTDLEMGRLEFEALARRIAKRLQIPLQLAMDALYIRAFVQTEEGVLAEYRCREAAESHFAATDPYFSHIRWSTEEEELQGSVDAVVVRHDPSTGRRVDSIGLQFKPESFFSLTHAGDVGLHTDQEKNLRQNLAWLETSTLTDIFYVSTERTLAGEFALIPLDVVAYRCFEEGVAPDIEYRLAA